MIAFVTECAFGGNRRRLNSLDGTGTVVIFNSIFVRALVAIVISGLFAVNSAVGASAALEVVLWKAVQYERPTTNTAIAASVCQEDFSLFLSLDQRSGRITRALATSIPAASGKQPPNTPRWSSHSIHEVNAKDLEWKENRLSGSLRCTVEPDMTIYGQRQNAEVVITIDVPVGTGGTYRGTYGSHKTEGRATLESIPATPNLTEPCEVTSILHGALYGPTMPAAAGGYCNISWNQSKVTMCTLDDHYGHLIWTTMCDGSGLIVKDGRMTGVIIAQVKDMCGKFGSGEYKWTIDAEIIGRRILGEVKAHKTTVNRGKTSERDFTAVFSGLIANTAELSDVAKWRFDYDQKTRRQKQTETKPPAGK